jgi:serine/threonine protein kinase
MDYTNQLKLSYYSPIATLNEAHGITLVQHVQTNKIYIQKRLDPRNAPLYACLQSMQLKGIPKIHEQFVLENELIVIEEYISGASLAQLIENKQLSFDLVLELALQLCDILLQLHAHQPSIIHRDIKPENCFLNDQGYLILMDFNAAKFYSEKEADTILLGTPGYAAPEQYGFLPSTIQTDLYAFGILLKEMQDSLTAKDTRFDSIIETCTQMNPADRFSSAAKLKEALQSLASIPAADKNHPIKNAFQNYGPPGFRSFSPAKILLSIPVYVFGFLVGISVNDPELSAVSVWIERIFTLAMFFGMLFITFNYRNIQQTFPLCTNANRWIRYAGILLFDLLYFSILVVVMSLLVGVIG